MKIARQNENSHAFIKITDQKIIQQENPEIEGIILTGCFDIQHYQQSLFNYFDIPNPKEILNMSAIRAASFLAGRVLSHKGMMLLRKEPINSPIQKIPPVLVGENQEPLFPLGFIGSISHSHSSAIVIILKRAANSHYLCGIDLEHIIATELISNIAPTVIRSQGELSLFNKYHYKELYLTLIFSIKESFYKSCYPHLQVILDFDVIDIMSIQMKEDIFPPKEGQHTNGCWIGILTVDLSPQLKKGRHITGFLTLSPTKVITGLYDLL